MRRKKKALAIVATAALLFAVSCCFVFINPETIGGVADGASIEFKEKKVVDSQETTDQNGNRTITHYYEDGTSQTVYVSKDNAGGSRIVHGDDDDFSQRKASGDRGRPDQSDSSLGQLDSSEKIAENRAGTSEEYEAFRNMSSKDQEAFLQSFESTELFMAWYKDARQAYQDTHPSIVINEGDVIHF